MNVRELIWALECLKEPEAEVCIVDPHEDYNDKPYGIYHDLTERLDNETTFAVQKRTVEGRNLVEIGSIAPFV